MAEGLGFNNINNLAGMNSMNDFMKLYQDNQKNFGGDNYKIHHDALNPTLKGYISQNSPELLQDQELANDLKTLTGSDNSLSTEGIDTNGMSADKAAKSFSNVIGDYITDVNSKQKASESASELYASGGNIDVHSVMIAAEKASLSMQLTMQMRNKVLQAYQEISRMPV